MLWNKTWKYLELFQKPIDFVMMESEVQTYTCFCVLIHAALYSAITNIHYTLSSQFCRLILLVIYLVVNTEISCLYICWWSALEALVYRFYKQCNALHLVEVFFVFYFFGFPALWHRTAAVMTGKKYIRWME